MTVIEVKENGAIRTKMLSCDSPEAAASVGEKLIPEGVGYHQEDKQQEEEIAHRKSLLSVEDILVG